MRSAASRYAARALGTAAVALIMFKPPGAFAQGLDGERFTPASGAAGGLQIERPVVPSHLGYGLGLFLNFADDAVMARDRVTGRTLARSLDSAFSTDFLASLGLFDFAELAVDVPLRLYYSGQATNVDGGLLSAAEGVGDVRLVPKFSFLWRGDDRGGVVLGAAAPVSLPTGRPSALRGSGGVTVEPRFLALFYGARWLVNTSVGFRFRAEEGASSPGNELTYGLGLTVQPFARDWLEGQVELVGGWLPDFSDRRLSALPLELLAALVGKPHPRWSIYAGAGAGLTNGVAVPDFRVLAGVRYAVGLPLRGGEKDSDGDGIADKNDRCPSEAEDFDGFEDEDGCPDLDNDHDGIPDDEDECPDDAEEPNGNKDGCPDHGKVVVRGGKLVVYGKVQFGVGADRILPQSEQLVDEMANALKDHPEIKRVEIQGHTDDTGDAGYNLELSQRRAESVKQGLVKRGLAPHRLVPKGYGEDRPIAPNQTRAGRAKNRRVDFAILD